MIEGVDGSKRSIGGFVRGIAINENDVYVGSSGIASGADRSKVDSAIYHFDSGWNLQAILTLEGEGQLLEIRTPGTPDSCYPTHSGKPIEFLTEGTFPYKNLPVSRIRNSAEVQSK